MAAVIVALRIIVVRSLGVQLELKEITKGRVPTASRTMKSGTKVKRKDCQKLCGSIFSIVARNNPINVTQIKSNKYFDAGRPESLSELP